MNRSSISDYDKFKNAVYEAATNGCKFRNFLKHPAILEIFGHYKYENALKIWDEMREEILTSPYFPDNQDNGTFFSRKEQEECGIHTPSQAKYFLLPEYDKLDSFATDDRYFEFQSFLLEFIRVAHDMKKSLDIENLFNYQIVELGVGFLGQYLTLNGDYQQYYLIDLPEVLLLAEKIIKKKCLWENDATIGSYMYNWRSTSSISTFDLERYPFKSRGLDHNGIFLSSHAFSELTTEHQDVVYDKVIRHCRYGYLLMNQISHLHGVNSYSMSENIEKLEGLGKTVKVHEEWPLTFKGNHVITWMAE